MGSATHSDPNIHRGRVRYYPSEKTGAHFADMISFILFKYYKDTVK